MNLTRREFLAGTGIAPYLGEERACFNEQFAGYSLTKFDRCYRVINNGVLRHSWR